jgi:hypothetical protein
MIGSRANQAREDIYPIFLFWRLVGLAEAQVLCSEVPMWRSFLLPPGPEDIDGLEDGSCSVVGGQGD